MAKRLDDFQFPGGRTSNRYPWAEWLDGAVWELVRGEDYEIPTQSFRSAASTIAQRRGMKVRSHATPNGLILQSYKDEATP